MSIRQPVRANDHCRNVSAMWSVYRCKRKFLEQLICPLLVTLVVGRLFPETGRSCAHSFKGGFVTISGTAGGGLKGHFLPQFSVGLILYFVLIREKMLGKG